MTAITRASPISVAARRFGYIVAIAINLALAYAINVWPGWQAVPFLTERTSEVIGLVNLSLTVSILVNFVYMVDDKAWIKALGDLVTASIGLAVLIRLWQVFPVDFSQWSTDWTWLARLVLVVGIIGAIIGVIVQFIVLVRGLIEE